MKKRTKILLIAAFVVLVLAELVMYICFVAAE